MYLPNTQYDDRTNDSHDDSSVLLLVVVVVSVIIIMKTCQSDYQASTLVRLPLFSLSLPRSTTNVMVWNLD